MKGLQWLQVAAVAVSTLCLLGLSAVLGRGAAPLSAAPLGLVAGAQFFLLLMFAWIRVCCFAAAESAFHTPVRSGCRSSGRHGGMVCLSTALEEVHLCGLQPQREVSEQHRIGVMANCKLLETVFVFFPLIPCFGRPADQTKGWQPCVLKE